MKMVKSLILGSAAGLVAMSGAQAADLPVKAKAVEYVRICSLYGAGFYYIPGTDTCIKLGGYLRVDMYVNANSARHRQHVNGAGGCDDRFTNAFTWRSREDLNIDTRTATEYGVVRTFFDAIFTWTVTPMPATATAGAVRSTRLGRRHVRSVRAEQRQPGAVATVRSASTTPSSSSLASRSVRPSRSSALPGPNYPGNNYRRSRRRRRHGYRCEPVHLHRSVRQRRVGAPSASRIRPAYYQAGILNYGAVRFDIGHLGALAPTTTPERLLRTSSQHAGRPGLGYVPGVGGRA